LFDFEMAMTSTSGVLGTGSDFGCRMVLAKRTQEEEKFNYFKFLRDDCGVLMPRILIPAGRGWGDVLGM